MATITLHPIAEKVRQEMRAIELSVLTEPTLGDLIRWGSKHSDKLVGGWVRFDTACAMGAGFMAAWALGWAKAGSN